jgi:hypothetical protein
MAQRLNIGGQSDRDRSTITVIADEDASHMPRFQVQFGE